MKKFFYFAYGSNLHPKWLNHRVHSAKAFRNVSINNWKLYFNKQSNDGSAKCNIIKSGSSGDIVYGVIYRLDPKDRGKLDKAEGGYAPEIMQIGEFDDVLVYLAKKEKINNGLLPYTWYKDIVILGAQYHNLPNEYIEFIRSFNTVIDSDQEREQKNRSILCHK